MPRNRVRSGSRPVSEAQPAQRAGTGVEYEPRQMIGQKYRLVRRLGEGGMASVWIALNEALDMHVAIKFIRGELASPALTDRLLNEARAAARLGHPAIVRVLDFGKTKPGDPYIVMELLNGEDLGTALERRGRIAAVKAVRTLLPIAHALATAHDKGIVHRDLKPENVFLAQNDDRSVQPKLVDFGVVKLDRPEFKRLTDVGTAVGSPGYMSPEQARGLDVDHRTDIWSFCVMLYEVVTGRLPFDGKTYNALLRSIIEDQPAPITNYAAGDSQLWAVLEKGLQKQPEARWSSMQEIGVALARWLTQNGVSEDIAGASLQAGWMQYSRVDSDAIALGRGRTDQGRASPLQARALGAATMATDTADLGRASTPTPVADEPSPVARSRGLSAFIAIGIAIAVLGVIGFMLLERRRKAQEAWKLSAPPAAVLPTPTARPTATTAPPLEQAQPAPPAATTIEKPNPEPVVSARPSESAEAPARKVGSSRPPARAAKPKPTGEELDIKTTF